MTDQTAYVESEAVMHGHPVVLDAASEKKIKDLWALRSKRFLQAELKRRGITYAELARRLTLEGLPETEGSITVKIGRGTFPVWWFLAALNAIGCAQVRLEDV